MTNCVSLAFSSFEVFGSGSAHASLIIDNQRVTQAFADASSWQTTAEDNGFVGYRWVDVPAGVLARATTVSYSKGAYPGGSTAFVGTGKEFLSQLHPRRAPQVLPPSGEFRRKAITRLGWANRVERAGLVRLVKVRGINYRDGSATARAVKYWVFLPTAGI